MCEEIHLHLEIIGGINLRGIVEVLPPSLLLEIFSTTTRLIKRKLFTRSF